MKRSFGNLEMSQAAQACCGCLATDTKLFEFNKNKLKDQFMELIGSPFQAKQSVRLPQALCSYCNALLLKCVAFRDRCRRSQAVLQLFDEDNLTAAYIGSVDRDHYNLNLNLSISNPMIIDSNKENDITIKSLEEDLDHKEYVKDEVNVKSADDKVVMSEEEGYETVSADIGDDDKRVPAEKQKTPLSAQDFESNFNFTIKVLSKEQQILELNVRKRSAAFVKSKNACNDCGKCFSNADKLGNHFMMAHDPNIGHYSCDLCNTKFEDWSMLRKHLISHRYRFNCNECSFSTKRQKSVKNHYKKHQGALFCCEHCGKCFSVKASYLSHLRKMHPSQEPWCRYCGESFMSDIGLQNHKEMSHYDVKMDQHVCLTCDVNFMNDKALQTHNRTSCSENSCFQCGCGFVEEQILRCHLLGHRKNCKLFRCIICGVVFENSKSLNTHLELSKGVCYGNKFCTKCGELFATEEEVEEHVLVMHSDKNFVCDECGRTYQSVKKLDQHTKQAHGPKKEDTRRLIGNKEWSVHTEGGETVIAVEKEVLKQKAKGDRNVCEFCKKAYSNKINLRIHRRRVHGKKSFQCHICEKGFATEMLCKEHISVHTGERPHKCLYCSKTFNNKPNVVRHMLIHTGERKHICTLCSKSFRTSTCVKAHIKNVHMKKTPAATRGRKPRNHPGERKHMCTMCSKAFRTSTCVKAHMKNVHMKKAPAAPRALKPRITTTKPKHVCVLCKEIFLTSSEAKLHLKQAHTKAPALPIVLVSNVEIKNWLRQRSQKK